MSHSLNSVWVIRCTLQIFRREDFERGTATDFIQFQPNFTESMLIRGEYKLLLFGDLPKIKKSADRRAKWMKTWELLVPGTL